ncbi:MAG: hypothetical protein KGJ84_11155 [Elusimicrobia bacterium]|nr:hypothetical protein [Elusimicrobiota bacterium]
MIPHPLTLLVGYLLGTGLSEGLGYVLEFVGELFADARRFGAIGNHVFAVALAGLGFLATFSGGFFIGASMRLIADDSWPKAALWALMTSLIIGLINSSIPMRMYPAVGIALMTTPRYVLLMPLGAVLGAFSVDRLRHDHRVEAARALFRGFLIWER